ncbi:hypothetical protein JQ617_13715 [Bradyrhizobium sp. KB893862 SZCCT0404]|uniref:hypothetical protein n=1 Tax=Bradyrhizobium sp. KB893862 SZCCT0404 TaxID=2807672 RepID=UPI001BA7579F|nr:hypothetical protein [Bradyrhizobium sp. KB893862 SZCCT0404]MBR1175021.1 hypothetical protein [Bradyrhizobium sp. KB893862 SZCCT0404]
MAGKQPGRHSGIHRSIHFLIIETGQSGIWEYRFRVGARDVSGKVQAILALLAARRVKMRIDKALKQAAAREATADGVAKPDAPIEAAPPAHVRCRRRASEPQQAASDTAVVFTCEACNAVYEALQVLVGAKGIFRCTVCYWPVHQWNGDHDYACWRLLGGKPRRS